MKKTIRRILFVSGCLFATVCLAAQTPEARSNARDAMNSGIAAFKSGNTQLAVDSFTRALQLDPDLIDAELYRGIAYASMASQNTEMSRKAIQSLERVLEKQPGNQDAASTLASVYVSVGEPAKARSVFSQITQASPQNAIAFYSLGALDWTIVSNKSNPFSSPDRAAFIEEGLQSLDVALSLNPQYIDAMTYRNLLLRQKAEITTDAAERAILLAEADTWFAKALEARAKNPTNGVTAGVGPGAAPPPPPPAPVGVRVGGQIAQTSLIRQVAPVYPQAARDARLQGTVVLDTSIDTAGQVVGVAVISGHPLLIDAAVQAVQQWTYRPVLLNGQPTDVVTTVTVNFVLR